MKVFMECRDDVRMVSLCVGVVGGYPVVRLDGAEYQASIHGLTGCLLVLRGAMDHANICAYCDHSLEIRTVSKTSSVFGARYEIVADGDTSRRVSLDGVDAKALDIGLEKFIAEHALN